jgi:hypothetical protein
MPEHKTQGQEVTYFCVDICHHQASQATRSLVPLDNKTAIQVRVGRESRAVNTPSSACPYESEGAAHCKLPQHSIASLKRSGPCPCLPGETGFAVEIPVCGVGFVITSVQIPGSGVAIALRTEHIIIIANVTYPSTPEPLTEVVIIGSGGGEEHLYLREGEALEAVPPLPSLGETGVRKSRGVHRCEEVEVEEHRGVERLEDNRETAETAAEVDYGPLEEIERNGIVCALTLRRVSHSAGFESGGCSNIY